jgi:hypothetical protein
VPFSFTATHATAAGGGELTLTVPPGWSVPQDRAPDAPGYVRLQGGSCARARIAHVSAATVDVRMTCAKGATFGLTFSDTVVPVAGGYYVFPTYSALRAGARSGPDSLLVLARQPTLSASPIAADAFRISVAGNVVAGAAAMVTITAIESPAYVASFVGDVELQSSDTAAVFPQSVHIANGSVTVPVTFKTAGAQTLVAESSSTLLAPQSQISVSVAAAAASSLVVEAPSTATAGTPISVKVSALDPFGNIATGYRGTVTFSSSDKGPGVSLPGPHTFITADAGTQTFAVTLADAGAQTISVSDGKLSAPSQTIGVLQG